MRKKCESGEELAVSTLLGEETFLEGNCYPKEVDMKVCIKKTGLSSVLQFDCKVLDKGHDIDFHIQNAYYLNSPSNLCSSLYRGPVFRYILHQNFKVFQLHAWIILISHMLDFLYGLLQDSRFKLFFHSRSSPKSIIHVVVKMAGGVDQKHSLFNNLFVCIKWLQLYIFE